MFSEDAAKLLELLTEGDEVQSLITRFVGDLQT